MFPSSPHGPVKILQAAGFMIITVAMIYFRSNIYYIISLQ